MTKQTLTKCRFRIRISRIGKPDIKIFVTVIRKNYLLYMVFQQNLRSGGILLYP